MTTKTAIILEEYRKARTEPFAWDCVHDCLGWANLVTSRLTGRNALEPLQGRYSTAKGAARVMQREAWTDLGSVCGAFATEVPIAKAQTGDWAVLPQENGTETVGVICGSMIAAKTQTGMGLTLRRKATRAFRVA